MGNIAICLGQPFPSMMIQSAVRSVRSSGVHSIHVTAIYIFHLPLIEISKHSHSLDSLTDSSQSSALQCSEKSMSAFWDKSLFLGSEVHVTLLDDSCDEVQANSTTIWITTKFNACGTITNENENHIIRRNKAIITSQNMNHSHFFRRETYEYDMSCLFERKHNAVKQTKDTM